MATLTVYGNTSDGALYSYTNDSYTTARATPTGTRGTTSGSLNMYWADQGATPAWYNIEPLYFSFLTSGLSAADTVTAVALTLYTSYGGADSDGVGSIYARSYAFEPLTTGDWRAFNGTSVGDTLLASVAMPSVPASDGDPLAFSSEAAFTSNINDAGNTELYVFFSDAESATAPTGENKLGIWMADETGTSKDPKLVITYTPAAVPVVITPGVLAQSLSFYAPTVSISDNQEVTPGVLNLSDTQYAPSTNVGYNISPGVLALVLTEYAPSIDLSDHQLFTPGVQSLVLTGLAPTALAPRTVTPGVSGLTLTGLVPSYVHGTVIAPGVLALTTAAFAPSVQTPRLVTPGVLALTLSTFAPVVGTPRLVTPGVLSLSLTGLAPSALAPRLVTPGVLALSTTGYAPAIVFGQIVTPGVLALSITGYAPVANRTVSATPATLALVITGYVSQVAVPLPLRGVLGGGIVVVENDMDGGIVVFHDRMDGGYLL